VVQVTQRGVDHVLLVEDVAVLVVAVAEVVHGRGGLPDLLDDAAETTQAGVAIAETPLIFAFGMTDFPFPTPEACILRSY
jgi:hypothetical protein